MSFNSLTFLAFAPIVLLLYWVLPHKLRPFLLLIGSYFFYCYLNFYLIFLIVAVTLISYFSAILMKKFQNKGRKVLMISTIILLLSSLFIFKYLNFALELSFSIASLINAEIEPIVLNIILPVGISFYTFQAMAYVVDVSLKRTEAEKNIFIFALFISYFPQLVAGPIEKSTNLIPQLKEEHFLNSEDLTYGLQDLIKGYVKKIVVADFLAIYVNNIFNNIETSSGAAILIATFLFGIVIYCDFSGYSEIAKGISRMMGIKLMVNFDKPYFSKSIKEFWNKWHISLNNFFVDYIYIPLGGSKKGKTRKCFNILIVFLLSGIWHGAKLTFIIWGIIHGILRIIDEFIPRKNNSKIINIVSFIGTFLIINFVWVFFRANTLPDAFLAYQKIFTCFVDGNGLEYFSTNNITKTFIAIILLIAIEYLPRLQMFKKKDKINDSYLKTSILSFTYTALIFLIAQSWLMTLASNGESQFIYFQF